MKKSLQVIGVVLIVICAIIIWGYCDLKKDPSPIYIPGRDTIKEWNDGECEIVGSSSLNELKFLKQVISRSDSSVAAYRKIDHQIFFIMTKGRIVVDLEAGTYARYENADSISDEYKAVFEDQSSFVWLSEGE